jgi:hypothetical protein
MVCDSCKNDIPDVAKFCPRCGAKIEQKEPAQSDTAQAPAAAAAAAPVAAGSAVGDAAASPGPAAMATPEPESASTSGPETAAAGPVKDETAVAAVKPKASPMPLVIVLLALFLVAAGGGYYYYSTYMKKDQPQQQAQIPGQSQSPGTPGGQPPQGYSAGQPAGQQPGAPADPSVSQPQPGSPQTGGPSMQAQPPQPYSQPGQPGSQAGPSMQPTQPITPPPPQDQYQPPQPRTRVAIKASSLATDFRNGRPVGFSTSFRQGASRVVHYVQYTKASVGQTTFNSQFYQNGQLIMKCGPSALQYASGNYFCRPANHLGPGNYEVKFFVDGNEEQILKFRVDY